MSFLLPKSIALTLNKDGHNEPTCKHFHTAQKFIIQCIYHLIAFFESLFCMELISLSKGMPSQPDAPGAEGGWKHTGSPRASARGHAGRTQVVE